MRIRGLRILLFPVVAPLILLGWVLYVVGERQACSKAVIKRKNQDYVLTGKSDENENKVEMGLIKTIVKDEVAN